MTTVEPRSADEWMRWRFGSSAAPVGDPGTTHYRRYEFARHEAPDLAAAALRHGAAQPFVPDARVSRRTVLFTDAGNGELVVVVGTHEPPRQVELALAYGCRHVGDRDLTFVVPVGTEQPFLRRLPWFDLACRVFTHHEGEVTEHPIPLQADVLETVASGASAAAYELSPLHVGWADEIISWANGHPRLVASHRSAYLAWQVEGRSVLKITRASGGRLRIAAGVVPGTDSPNATGQIVELDAPLANPEPLREAVRRAIAARIGGGDEAQVEHRLQARFLALAPDDRLGLARVVPEYPAARPRADGYAPGFIDFLGVDGDGRLQVVEMKVGAADPLAAVQALDYWVWVKANLEAVAADVGADPDLGVGLGVVVLPGADGRLLHRDNRFVIERFARSVPVAVHAVDADLDGAVQIRPLPFAAVRSSDRFSSRLRRRIGSAAEVAGHRATRDAPLLGLSRAGSAAARELAGRGELHGYVHLAHSSQRFALALFSSLGTAGAERLLAERFGPMATADPPAFEWSDPDDLLGESTPTRPNRTTVDVLLSGRTDAGRRVALLVEVKLTETAFGGCSHGEVAPAAARANCNTPGPFGGSPSSCWQLRNRELGQPRRYAEVLAVRPDAAIGAVCSFRSSNQPMRNAALAMALVQAGRFDDCKVALCAPTGHGSMRRRWIETAALVGPELLGFLDPEAVLGALGQQPDVVARLISTYGLAAPTRPADQITGDNGAPDGDAIGEHEHLAWAIAAELVGRHPDLWLIETHPGGGTYDCLALYPSDNGWPADRYVDLNLGGRIHAHGSGAEPLAWSAVAELGVPATVRLLEDHLRASPTVEPARWPRGMARMAERHGATHRWRNGVSDSSGYGADRGAWLDVIAGVAAACVPERGAPLENPAYRFWFLVEPSEDPSTIVAAVDVRNAIGWTRGGGAYDLAADIELFEHDVQAVVAAQLGSP